MKRLLPALALLFLAVCARAEWLSDEQAIMGTAVRVELWHDDAAAGRAAIAAVMDEMRRIDREMSPFKPESPLSLLNREATRRPVAVSAELFGLIGRAQDFSRLTGGAFDITFASVGRYYDYRKGVHPSEAQLARSLPAIDYRHVQLDDVRRTVRFATEGVSIDLGGIAKGHAVDRSIALLRERGVRHAVVTAGGDSFLLGDRNGRPWMMGIRDPRRHDAVSALLPLSDGAISTSGDYERYFVADGVLYHHILNPKTGKSAKGLRSATVIGPDTTTTDALSTSVFVLGEEKGMALIESLPGIEAVIITEDGRMRFSSGLDDVKR